MSFEIIVYFSLSMLSVFLGIIYLVYPAKGSLFFLLFGMIIPTSNQFMDFTSYSGVYFYDYFFISVSIYYLIILAIKKQFCGKNMLNLLLITLFFSCYVFAAIYSSVHFDKYLLRDFRPILTLFYAVIFIEIAMKNKLNTNMIINILILGFSIKILFFLFLLFNISYSDIYYQQNAFRYFDGTTFIAALFLIVSIFKFKILNCKVPAIKINLTILLALIIILISNLRIILFALLVIYLIVYKQRLIKKIMVALLGFVLFISYSYFLNIERVLDSFVTSEVILQLITRFAPAVEKINQMTSLQYIFGLGMGTYFEIPWFEYRGLDSKLNTIDSTYLTFFVKYGLLGVFVIIFFFRLILMNVKNLLIKRSLLIFYLILFLTISTLYQSGAILQILFLNIFIISLNNESSSRTIPVNP